MCLSCCKSHSCVKWPIGCFKLLTCYLPSPACQVRCFPLLLRRLKRKSVLMMMDDYIIASFNILILSVSQICFVISGSFDVSMPSSRSAVCHIVNYHIFMRHLLQLQQSTIDCRTIITDLYYAALPLCHAGLTGVAVSHL